VIYKFTAHDGREIERDFAPGDVPEWVEEDGTRYRGEFGCSPRLPGLLSKAPGMIVKDQSHLAHSAPRSWTAEAGNEANTLDRHYDKWGPHGVAVIEGGADRRRFEDALTKVKPRNSWKYDP
jgi:hypothetical protein